MSNVIHMLPDSVANQIAAGEVIQRPASVIKELTENAIDAGATDIKVIVRDGGRTLIQVIDNGCGMSETDARMAFERHATSKITQVTDLYALHTMGFRGEALPSIAAVAQVELLTRRKDDELGVKIEIAGSKVSSQEPVSTAVGSQFCVRNLFFNIPARRAFLKSDTTELRHITTEFLRVALAHPDVAMSLSSNGTPLYILQQGNVQQRISTVMGKALAQELVPIELETALVSIKGFVGTPETARKTGADQFFFANDRYMRSPYFHKAVTDAYKNIIPSDQTPAYFIYISVDPHSIDVNVHPQKTEIKFEDETAIWHTLNALVRDCLGKYNFTPSLDFDTADSINIPTYVPHQEVSMAGLQNMMNANGQIYNPFEHETGEWNENSGTTEHKVASRLNSGYSPRQSASTNGWEGMYKGIYSDQTDQATYVSRLNKMNATDPDGEADTYETCVQYAGKYIAVSTSKGFLIIDQHRAHECVQYEAICKKMNSGDNFSQKLIFPEILPMSAEDACIIEEVSVELEKIGMEVSYDSNEGKLSVNAIPAQLELSDVGRFVELLIFDIRNGEANIQDNLMQYVVQTLASKSAIPYGKTLSSSEMTRLCTDLFACQSPAITPSGKRVFIVLSDDEIDSRF